MCEDPRLGSSRSAILHAPATAPLSCAVLRSLRRDEWMFHPVPHIRILLEFQIYLGVYSVYNNFKEFLLIYLYITFTHVSWIHSVNLFRL